MKIINKMKKNEYFLIKNFLFLAAIFIAIIVLSGIILSYSFIKTSDEKIIENTNNNAAYISNMGEKKILELSELVRYITLNKNMNYTLYNKGTDSSAQKSLEVVDALKLMILNANSVESVYIYNKNLDYLTTSDGTVPIKAFNDMGWLDLYNNLEKNELGVYFRKTKNSDVYKITLICRAIKNEFNDSGVIMNVDISRMMDFEKDSLVTFMYDKSERRILYNSGYIASENDYTDFLSSAGGIIKIDNNWYSMAKAESASGNFEYIVLEKAEDYLSSKVSVCVRILIVLAVMMLIFTFIAFAVANLAYETIRIIREISENPTTTKYNEYLENDINTKKIADTIFRVVSNNEKLYTQLSTTMKNYGVAQLKALQWQINPHFIFNTLNTLYYISDKDAGSDSDIANGILILSELMRYSLKTEPAIVTFDEEIKITKNYIALMRLRFKNRFDVEWSIERKFFGYKVTKLCLQPVLENCFSYAVKKSKERILIKIEACEKNGVFQISISDSGKGIDEKNFGKIQSELMKETDKSEMHIGLTNVHNRIRLMYGTQYGITLVNKVGEGLTVILKFPDNT